MSRPPSPNRLLPFPQSLTPAERRTVEALIRLGTPKQVAKLYDNDVATVRTQIQHAREKAGVRSTVHLAIAFLSLQVPTKPSLQTAWEQHQLLGRVS